MGPASWVTGTRSELGSAGFTGLDSRPVNAPPGETKPSMWSNDRFSNATTTTWCGLAINAPPSIAHRRVAHPGSTSSGGLSRFEQRRGRPDLEQHARHELLADKQGDQPDECSE